SNTWSSTALEVVSEAFPGWSEGGSSLILILSSCSSAKSASSALSLLESLSLSLLFTPHATRKMLRTKGKANKKDHFFQFIFVCTPLFEFTDNSSTNYLSFLLLYIFFPVK